MTDNLEFQIARLRLEPGDVLVVKLAHNPGACEVDSIRRYFAESGGIKNQVAVIGRDVDLSVLSTTPGVTAPDLNATAGPERCGRWSYCPGKFYGDKLLCGLNRLCVADPGPDHALLRDLVAAEAEPDAPRDLGIRGHVQEIGPGPLVHGALVDSSEYARTGTPEAHVLEMRDIANRIDPLPPAPRVMSGLYGSAGGADALSAEPVKIKLGDLTVTVGDDGVTFERPSDGGCENALLTPREREIQDICGSCGAGLSDCGGMRAKDADGLIDIVCSVPDCKHYHPDLGGGTAAADETASTGAELTLSGYLSKVFIDRFGVVPNESEQDGRFDNQRDIDGNIIRLGDWVELPAGNIPQTGDPAVWKADRMGVFGRDVVVYTPQGFSFHTSRLRKIKHPEALKPRTMKQALEILAALPNAKLVGWKCGACSAESVADEMLPMCSTPEKCRPIARIQHDLPHRDGLTRVDGFDLSQAPPAAVDKPETIEKHANRHGDTFQVNDAVCIRDIEDSDVRKILWFLKTMGGEWSAITTAPPTGGTSQFMIDDLMLARDALRVTSDDTEVRQVLSDRLYCRTMYKIQGVDADGNTVRIGDWVESATASLRGEQPSWQVTNLSTFGDVVMTRSPVGADWIVRRLRKIVPPSLYAGQDANGLQLFIGDTVIWSGGVEWPATRIVSVDHDDRSQLLVRVESTGSSRWFSNQLVKVAEPSAAPNPPIITSYRDFARDLANAIIAFRIGGHTNFKPVNDLLKQFDAGTDGPATPVDRGIGGEKLVRDGYEARMPGQCRRVADDAELKRFLDAKVDEELAELRASGFADLTEWADVFEVLGRLAGLSGFTYGNVKDAMKDKTLDRGGFNNGVIHRLPTRSA